MYTLNSNYQLNVICSRIPSPHDSLETIPTATFTILDPDPMEKIPISSFTILDPDSLETIATATFTMLDSDSLETITTAIFTILDPPPESMSIFTFQPTFFSTSEKSLTTPELDSTTSASESTQLIPISPLTTSSMDASSSVSFENATPTTPSTSHQSITAASGSTKTSATPTGLIVGVVVGGLVGLGILIILFICFRRRRTPTPPYSTPVPLPYDPSYIQPLDKNSQLAQITREREAAQRQHDQLQETISLRESAHNGLSGLDPPLWSDPLEQQLAVVRQRMLELAVQQRDLEDQLYGGQPPPSYSNSSSLL